MVGSGAGCEYRQFVFGDAHTLGQDNAEAVEECSLGDIRLRHAAQANLALCCGGQDHIMRLNTCEFFKDRSRRVSEARMLLPHLEALPQHEGEKADQDMGLNAILALMPDRTYVQLILRKPPRRDALRRGGLMVENCTYGQSYDQCVEST